MDRCGCGQHIEQPATGRRRLKCAACSPTRQRNRSTPALGTVPPTTPTRLPVTVPDGTPGHNEAATLAELEAAGRETTSAGVEALHMARLLDRGGYTAQGAAALGKARREALGVATAGAAKAADALEDLRSRRLAKAAGA